jgi:uncharacterized protein with PIN domain
MSWLMKKLCEHHREWIVERSDKYANGHIDKSIFCCNCGKVILPSEHYDEIKELLSGGGEQ